MSWPSTLQLYRQALSVDNTAGGAGAFDATSVLPPEWSHFWDTVQSGGTDMRVMRADGVTPVTKFDLNGFNKATYSGTLELQDTADAAGTLCYWLVWGDSTLSSGTSAFAPAAAKTMTIDLGYPVKAYTLRAVAQERLDSTDTLEKFAKTSDSTLHIWVDFSRLMQQRAKPSKGSRELECIKYANVTAAAGLTATATATTFLGGDDGDAIVKVQLSDGSTANDYLVTVTAVTTLGRTLTSKFGVVCRDVAA